VIPHSRVGSHALLTRSPLPPKRPCDLHVLGMPPAFVLSQDQTLKLIAPHQPKPDEERSELTRFIASVSYRFQRYASTSGANTRRRPRIPSILLTCTTARPPSGEPPLSKAGIQSRDRNRLRQEDFLSRTRPPQRPRQGAGYLVPRDRPVQPLFPTRSRSENR